MLTPTERPPLGKVAVVRGWDPSRLETIGHRPQGSAAVMIWWDEPGRVDAGPSPRLATALAAALTAVGEVSFRWCGAPPPDLRVLTRLRSRLLRLPTQWRIVSASSASCAVRVFQDWHTSDPAAMVAATDRRSCDLLARRDLRTATLHDDEVVFAAIVDGDGAVLAARNEGRLADVIAIIVTRLVQAGFLVVPQGRWEGA